MNNNIKTLDDLVREILRTAKIKGHNFGIFISYKIDSDAFKNGKDAKSVDIVFGYSTLSINEDIEIRVLSAFLKHKIQINNANKKQIEVANNIINEGKV